jgi:hypothetical protein
VPVMGEWEMAEAIAHVLNDGSWKAKAELGDIDFTNEDGERFLLTVEKVEDEEAEGEAA